MIKSLSLTNFRKHSAVDLYFDEPSQIILISGKNGVGKTTILESILYALYGESRYGKKYLDQLVKRGSELEGMSVELVLTLNNNDYRIHRRRDNKISTAILYCNDLPLQEGANEVSVEVGKLLGMDSTGFKLAVLAQQKELEGLSSLRPSERNSMVSRLLRLDLLSKAKEEANSNFRKERDIFKELQLIHDSESSVVSLEALELELNAVKDNIVKLNDSKFNLENEMKKLSSAQILFQQSEVKINVLSNDLIQLEKEISESENELGSIVIPDPEEVPSLDFNELTNEIVEVERTIREAEIDSQNKKKKEELEKEIKSLESEIRDLESEIKRLTTKDSKLQDKYKTENLNKNSLELTIKEKNSNLSIKNFELQQTKDNLKILGETGTKCALCSQDVTKEHIEMESIRFSEKIANLESEVKILNQEIIDLNEKLTESLDELDSISAAIKTQESNSNSSLILERNKIDKSIKLSQIKNQAQSIVIRNLDVEDLLEKKSLLAIQALKFQSAFDKNRNRDNILLKVSFLNQNLAKLVKQRTNLSLQLTENEIPDELAQNNKRFYEVKEELVDIDREITLLKIDESRLSEKINHENSVKALSAQRLARIDGHQKNAIRYSNASILISSLSETLSSEVRPLLEAYVTNILSLMSNGRFSKVSISEDYDILVFDDHKFRTLSELSGGECDLVALSLRLALSQVVSQRHGSGGCGFLILDECFASQDSERREAVLSSLRNLKNVYKQIFIVSHIEKIEDFVDSVIEIELNDDRSDTNVISH